MTRDMEARIVEIQETGRLILTGLSEEPEFRLECEESIHENLRLLYEVLSDVVMNGCSKLCDGKIDFARSLPWVDKGNALMHSAIRMRCGITLSKAKNSSCTGEYEIEGLAGVRNCIILRDDEEVELDFLALIAESERRQKLWQARVPTTARKLAQEIEVALKNEPSKIYGIPNELFLGMGETNPLEDLFDLDGLMIDYCDLTKTQWTALNQAVNALLMHGEIKLNWNGLYIYRSPQHEVKNPLFDYADYYAKYDEVTPELQAVFERIVENLSFVSPAEQIYDLSPSRSLLYDNGEHKVLSYDLVKSRHLQSLYRMIEEAFPGLKITGCERTEIRYTTVPFDAPKVRIEFNYEICDDNSGMEGLKTQFETEALINKIKACNKQAIAEDIVGRLLDRIDKEMIYDFAAHRILSIGCQSELYYHKVSDLVSDASDAMKDLTVSMSDACDKEWVKEIGNLVNSLTDGLIEAPRLRSMTLKF